jgi:hypothetical protein
MTMRKIDYAYGRLEYEAPTVADIINSMSNWQRSQWARAGYPQKDISDVLPFAVKRKG